MDKTSVDYPAVKVRYASYEQIEKRALIHQQDSGDITKDFLVRTLLLILNFSRLVRKFPLLTDLYESLEIRRGAANHKLFAVVDAPGTICR